MMWHSYPENDLEPHELEGTQCKCNPRIEVVEESGDILVKHNSFDGREIAERLIDEMKLK